MPFYRSQPLISACSQIIPLFGTSDLSNLSKSTILWTTKLLIPSVWNTSLKSIWMKYVRSDIQTWQYSRLLITFLQNFVQYVLVWGVISWINCTKRLTTIQNDVLGQVDNCHLALSDMYTPFDPRCLHLSEIHSVRCLNVLVCNELTVVLFSCHRPRKFPSLSAIRLNLLTPPSVDFAKTGQAAALDPSLRPKEWPDFMDKVSSFVWGQLGIDTDVLPSGWCQGGVRKQGYSWKDLPNCKPILLLCFAC